MLQLHRPFCNFFHFDYHYRMAQKFSDTVNNKLRENEISFCAGKSGKIVGGREARSGELPFLALILHNDEPYCGGAILTSQSVVTAAHCLLYPSGHSGKPNHHLPSFHWKYRVAFGFAETRET